MQNQSMSDGHFAEFVRRIRAGDEQAAAELVRQYEPLVRREIRLGLTEPSLCRVLDSMDICQSVMASFFVQAACGRYDLEEPGQVIKLLIGMAPTSSPLRCARTGPATGRAPAGGDRRGRIESSGPRGGHSQSDRRRPRSAPCRARAIQRGRTPVGRAARWGQDWAGIALEMGGTAEARRHQLTRALDRVTQQLGLND